MNTLNFKYMKLIFTNSIFILCYIIIFARCKPKIADPGSVNHTEIRKKYNIFQMIVSAVVGD